jgi:hypothetical protein
MKSTRSDDDKFTTIISKNTFFFHREVFEEKNEVYLNGVKETLLLLKNEIATNGLRKETISKLLAEVGQLIKEHYPKAKFIGFIDGVGWYVRRRDLKRMIDAFDDVFTFHGGSGFLWG